MKKINILWVNPLYIIDLIKIKIKKQSITNEKSIEN
jgi:hypothetical protein